MKIEFWKGEKGGRRRSALKHKDELCTTPMSEATLEHWTRTSLTTKREWGGEREREGGRAGAHAPVTGRLVHMAVVSNSYRFTHHWYGY